MNEFEDEKAEFVEEAEKIGFNVAEKNVMIDASCCQGSGASFSCKVDVLKYIDAKHPGAYPRLREKYKEGQFDINIIRTDSRYCHEYTMSTDIRDNIEEDKKEELSDALGEIAEGGKDLVDNISELAELILEDARNMAKQLHRKAEASYLASEEPADGTAINKSEDM